ncbi:hypothetical protein Psta_1474 [Pirellula staleyi DSM 6068]|uniref:DUF1598 domain-containing protein n=1 Tax=Pirellula staleyi (strain ATCC 27377 / DSM 6068 / ICPB 4128) TaxID=530564 RepID=D2QXG4_PIRSD|nr:hypothetical protein [Pirellula staleyi]ADB16149.1 hypothetical protein Psta_1474 [Pirellula staleyi DSM 6068]
MLRSHLIPTLLLAAALLLASAERAEAQFESLAAKVPGSANAIVLLDTEKIMASPLAEKEGWKLKYEQAFASGLVTIAPDTKQMILAAQMDYQTMRPLWEVALADYSTGHTIAEIAREAGGTLDQIGSLQAVALSDDSYCVQLDTMRLGVMAPANRQTVSRWIRDVSTQTEPKLSPYLMGTLKASETSQVVVAFDLEDAVPASILKMKLAGSSALSGKNVDMDAAAQALASLRGVVLEMAVTDESFGRLMVHFNQDATILAPYAKPILIEALTNLGLMIDDIETWTASTEANRFSFHGPMSREGRKRVLTLIDHPTAALIAANKSRSQSQLPEASRVALSTQQYFKAITAIRDDARRESSSSKTLGQNAMWLDNWARRIDRLPVLNVDPEMLAYGRYTTQRMRDASTALKGIGINSAAMKAQVYQEYTTSGSSYGGFWGGGYDYTVQWNNVAGQRRAIGAEQKAQGATTARAIFAEMDNETAKVRQVMSQKYQLEF